METNKKRFKREALLIGWMNKLPNAAFASFVEELHGIIERKLAGTDKMKISRLILDRSVSNVSRMRARYSGHIDTNSIHKLYDDMKAQVTAIKLIINGNLRSPIKEHAESAVLLKWWISAFPKRPYDKIMVAFNFWIDSVLTDYHKDYRSDMREGARMLGLDIFFDQLEETLNKANKLMHKRTIELGTKGNSEAYEQRRDMQESLQGFMDDYWGMLNYYGEEDEDLKMLYYELKLVIKLLHAVVKQRETKRKRRKERMALRAEEAAKLEVSSSINTTLKVVNFGDVDAQDVKEQDVGSLTTLSPDNLPTAQEFLENPELMKHLSWSPEDDGYKLLMKVIENELNRMRN